MRPLLTGVRLGDFVEFFEDDAFKVARVLEVVVTTQRATGRKMCGLPVHRWAADRAALIGAGFEVEPGNSV